MVGNYGAGIFVKSAANSAIHEAAASQLTTPALPGIIPVELKSVHWLWMGAAGRNGLWRVFCTVARNPAALWIAL